MELDLHTYLIVCPLIFLAGFFDSIAGGGGIISLPAYLLAGLPMHNALATNKFSSCSGSIIATFRYLKNKCYNKVLLLPTVICALVGSSIGANLALHTEDKYLRYLLLIVLPIVTVLVFLKKDAPDTETVTLLTLRQIILASIIALIIGGYDGFYGPGTGTLLILMLTGLVKLSAREASGNTKCINFASNIAALITFIINGKVLYSLGIAATLCSILGNYIGSGLVIKNGAKIVRPILIVMLCLLIIKLILD